VHAFQTAQAMHDVLHDDTLVHISAMFSEEEYNMLPLHIKDLYKLTYGNLIENLLPVNKKDGKEQFITMALIHDFGKILCDPAINYPQWSVVGDTFIIGFELPPHAPYQRKQYHETNQQIIEYPLFCGFENMIFSFGHDEYMAQVLERSHTTLLHEFIYIIRYHSFYSWHSPPEGIQRAHEEYANDMDWKMLPLLKLFQKCDLYSKKKNETIHPTLISMAEKYIPTLQF
jgi:inositol oxygenase